MENPFTPLWPESRKAEPGILPGMLCRIVGFLSILILLCCPAFSQSIAVTSPAAAQTLSGTSFTLACSLSSLPNAQSVEWFVNGLSQGVVRSAPWSLAWNTNDVFNSGIAWHTVYAVARGALGNSLATSPVVNFGIYNSYLEPSSYIACGTITPSTSLTSPWSGTVTISVPITGTNASNQKYVYALVAGDLRVYSMSAVTSTNISIPIKTTMFPNGIQTVTVLIRDQQGGVGTIGGYPFCQWEQQVTFANPAGTAMELLVSPREAVIAPTATLQLSPIIDNTDGTTSAATGATYSSGATGVCTVNSSGLVTGVAYGTCPITVTSNNGSGYTRTIYEYVSSTNVVPHFGTDGAIHNTYVPGVSMWFASIFQSTGNTSLADPFKTTAQYLSPYVQAGFNAYEAGPMSGNSWGPNQSAWQTGVNSFVTQYSGYLSPYHVFFHPQMTTVLGTCGGGNALACGTGSSSLYNSTRSPAFCAGYSPVCWTYLAQQWYSTGLLMGFSSQDEGNSNYLWPNLGTGVIGTANAPAQLTCNTSAPTTWNVLWASPGPDYNGTLWFSIFGGTTHSQLNSTIGTASTYQVNVASIASTGFSFTGPSCASGNVTVNSASDPGLSLQIFGFEWDNNNTDYVHNTDYTGIVTSIHAGTGAITIPVAGSVQAGASIISQQGWQGNCTSPPPYGDYAEIYDSQDNSAFSHPQHAWVNDFMSPGSQSLVPQIRYFWGNTCTPRAFAVKTEGTPMDYGLQGSTETITGIVGPTVTFAAPHGITTVFPSVSRLTISGSSNSYFNGNQLIDSCPTATTCNISLYAPSSGSGIANSGPGTLLFQDGKSWTNVTLAGSNSGASCTGGGTCNTAQILKEVGQHFTYTCTSSCGSSPAYYANTTFVLRGDPISGPVSGSGNAGGPYPSQMLWDEVPPASETSGSATAVVYANNSYIKGVNHNTSESLGGLNWPFASCAASGVLGATGIRAYQAGIDVTEQAVLGGPYLVWGSTNNALIQAGLSPVYDNGETTAIETFWAYANCNAFMQRMATTGYLYQPRYGVPDVGYNIVPTLRKGSKGNLLMAINMQDGPQTRTVDLSNCEVAGQPILRYTVTYSQIALAVLGAGATSDTPVFPDAGLVAYLCSNNYAAEIDQPTIAARLADVSGASSIVVQFSYNPEAFGPSRFAQAPQAVVATNGMVTLPVDRNIGTIYLRLVYLDGSGTVLATSDIETL